MKRELVLEKIKEYFKIQELVDSETYSIHRERSWKFFDTDLLKSLLIIREGIAKPMRINNWSSGGGFSQRGLRTNTCSIVKNKTIADKLYLSAHCLGKGVDFDVIGMEAEEVREWIKKNINLFNFKIRLEHLKGGVPISWVHLDTIYEENNPEIYLFNV